MKPDQIALAIHKAAEAWHSEQTPEAIQEKVNKTLDAEFHGIFLRVLGFTKNTWGDLEICDGNNGVVIDIIRKAAIAHIKKTDFTVDVSELMHKKTAKRINDLLADKIDIEIRRQHFVLEDVAAKTVKEIADALGRDHLDNVIKLLKVGNED